MGPTCPFCGALYEWTCGEFSEVYYFPRTYICASVECLQPFTLDVEELEEVKEKFGGGFGDDPEETEDDWRRARDMYEKGEY